MNELSAATREDVYRLLAACYYSPTPAFLEEGCCLALSELLAAAMPEAAAQAAEASALATGQSAEALSVEHARLFIGPFQLVAPPYGSYYLEQKTVMGDSTERVADFYAGCGLHLAEDFHELPDHITAELEFMSFLAFKQRGSEAAANSAESKRFAELQREFLSSFLLPWVGPFTQAVIDDAESPFYRAVARCTRLFLEADGMALAQSPR